MISATSILSNYSSSVSLNVSDKIQQNTFSKPPEIDQDGNGSISKDEFQTLISNISKMTGQSIDSEELFKQFDADEDGSLSKDEMKALFDSKVLPEPPRPSISSNAMGQPPSIDEDGDGSIDKNEFNNFTSNISKMSGQTIDSEELFAQFDQDEDGTLSESEMQALFDSKVLPEPPKPIEDSRVNKQSGSENIIATYSDKNSSNQRTSFFVNSSI